MSCQPASEVSKPIAGRTIGASLAEGDRLNLIVLGVNEMTHGDVGLRPGAMLSAASTVACGWSGACIGSRFDSMHRAFAQRGVRSRSLIVGGRHILALAALSPSSAALCAACIHPQHARRGLLKHRSPSFAQATMHGASERVARRLIEADTGRCGTGNECEGKTFRTKIRTGSPNEETCITLFGRVSRYDSHCHSLVDFLSRKRVMWLRQFGDMNMSTIASLATS